MSLNYSCLFINSFQRHFFSSNVMIFGLGPIYIWPDVKHWIKEPKSNKLHPYQFQAELTEWSGLDQISNICRNNVEVQKVRQGHYHSIAGRVLIKSKFFRYKFLFYEFKNKLRSRARNLHTHKFPTFLAIWRRKVTCTR